METVLYPEGQISWGNRSWSKWSVSTGWIGDGENVTVSWRKKNEICSRKGKTQKKWRGRKSRFGNLIYWSCDSSFIERVKLGGRKRETAVRFRDCCFKERPRAEILSKKLYDQLSKDSEAHSVRISSPVPCSYLLWWPFWALHLNHTLPRSHFESCPDQKHHCLQHPGHILPTLWPHLPASFTSSVSFSKAANLWIHIFLTL